MTQRSRFVGAVLLLLLLSYVLSGCGSSPVAQNWPGLSVYDGNVYVISGAPQQVYILDAETGSTKATFLPAGEHKGVIYWSPVTVAEGLAFVGFAEQTEATAGLYAFDPETGQEQWHVAAKDLIIPAPVYANGVVYFGSSSGHVYAVDIETQQIKPGWPFEAGSAVWGSPLVVGDKVYVASMDHHVYSLEAETGEMLWKTSMGGAMAAQPTHDTENDLLYVGNYVAHVNAIAASTGEIVEGFEFTADNWIWSEVLADGEVLYVTSLDGKLYALDPATGDVISPYPFDSSAVGDQDDRIRAAPVSAGEATIVATESGRVMSVVNAREQWVWPGGAPQAQILTTPVVHDGKVYVVLMTGVVQALDAETGTQGWTFAPPESD